MDSRLEQAKEWASRIKSEQVLDTPFNKKTLAAAEVIQSLPDQWIDAEKVVDLADDMSNWTIPSTIDPENITDMYRELVEIMDGFTGRINELITPPLPTLAEMTPEEREACRWMQAQTWHEVGIIVWMDELTEIAQLITRVNGVLERKFKDVTPLPDLPPMKWPGSTPDDVAYATGGALTTQDVVDECRAVRKERALPRPEDVPAGEPWLVKCDGHEWVGTRESKVETVCSWALARLDGADYTVARDDEITLVSRLLPENKENA